MRKNLISRLSSFSLFSVLMALIAFGSPRAAAATVDLGEIEFGKTYSIPNFSSVTGTLTAVSTGKMQQVGCQDIHLFADAELNNEVKSNFEGYLAGGATLSYELTKGQTYYIYAGFTMSGTEVTFYMDGASEQPLEAQFNVSPGTTLNFANYPVLQLYLSREATADTNGSAIIYTNAKTGASAIATPRTTLNGTTLSVYVYDVLKPLIADGSLLPGSEVTVMLKDVKTTTGTPIVGTDDNGYVSYKYLCGSIPTASTGSKVPSKFLSYWAPGNEDGIISMTFSDELSVGEKTCAKMIYGNIESETGAYVEVVPVTLSEDAKTIYADFTGKLRTPQIMTPQEIGTVYDFVSVIIVNVLDKYGNPVQSEGQGTVGTYSWSIPYSLIERTPITAEFTPANGKSLNGFDEISVYLSPLKSFTFTGFKLTYADGDATKTVVVDKAAAKAEIASDGNSADYTFAVPAEVKGKKNITVSLDNLVTSDGYDHTLDVQAFYDSFVITYADPANGSEMAKIESGTIFTVETNYSEQYPEMYMVYEIEDMNPVDPDQAIIKSESWFNRQEDGTYTTEIHGNYKLLLGHEYRVNFTAWENEMAKNYRQDPVGTTFITWYGTTPEYQYSSIVLESITPDPGTVLTASDNVITLQFDGLVIMDSSTTFINLGMGSTAPFESITPIDPQDNDGIVFSNIWELKISDSFLATLTAQLDISFKATDMDGRLVKGNEGTDENTYFYYVYDFAGRYASYDVTAVGEEPFKSVKEFTASSSRGINFSYYKAYSDAYVVDRSRAVVAYVSDVIAKDTELGEKCTEQTLVLDNAITDEGTYTLVIPREYFVIDEEFSSQNSDEVMYTFEVIGDNDPDKCRVSLTPEEGEVGSLPEDINMYFLDTNSIGIGSGYPTLTIDGGEPIRLDDVELDWDVLNLAILHLPQTYTEAGTYVISFPAGYFTLGDDGKEAPALEFTYIIKSVAQLNVTADPAEGNVESLPTQILLTFNDYMEAGIGAGFPTLTIDDAEPFNLPDAEYGPGWNQIYVNVVKPYNAAGTYVFSFPAGYFILDGTDSPAFTLTYTIGGTTGINGVAVAEDGLYHVYNVAGVQVLETANFAEVLSLNPGLYIVNGAKLLVK